MTTLTPQPDLADLRRGLLERLARFGRRARTHLVAAGAVRAAAVAVGLVLFSVLIDYRLHLSLPARLVFLGASAAAVGYAVWRYVLRPASAALDPVDLAAALDRSASGGASASAEKRGLAPRVATVLQLPTLIAEDDWSSPAMVAAAVRDSHERLRGVDFEAGLDQKRLRRDVLILAVVLALPILLALWKPAVASLWAKRWLLASNEPWPQRTHLDIPGLAHGRIIVPRGEPLAMRVVVREGSEAPDRVLIRIDGAGDDGEPVAMTKFADGDFRYELPSVQDVLTVRVWGGDDRPDPFAVEPVDRPRIVGLTLVSQHPTQPQPETRSFAAGESDAAFLPKTRLSLTLAANTPLAEVRIKNSSARPAAMTRLDEKRYAAEWEHEAPVNLQVELVSAAGLTSLPTPISIGLKKDQPPRVTLQSSGVKGRVTPQAKIPTTLLARDDQGLIEVALVLRPAPPDAADPMAVPEQAAALYGPTKPAKEVEFQGARTVEVAPLKLAVGSLLSVFGRAADECFTGAQTGQSRVLTFRIVAPEELFRDILLRQQQERMKFRKATEEATRLREALEAATSAEAWGQAARRHRAVQREAARVMASLADSLLEMQLNALGGQEAYDLMRVKVLEPLKKLHDGRMTQQRDALDALGQGREGDAPAAVARQEAIAKEMRDVLKGMSQWDSFVDVLNQLNEIIKLENQVKQATEELRKRETERIFDPK